VIYAFAPYIDFIFAGAVFVTVAYFPNGIPTPPAEKLRDCTVGGLEAYIRTLDESGVVCLDYVLYPEDINSVGYTELARRKINHGAARLEYEQKLINPSLTLCSVNIPYIKEIRCAHDDKSPARFALEAISEKKRVWLITKHYRYLLPDLALDKNLGRLNKDSAALLLDSTFSLKYCIKSTLRLAPKLWIAALETNHPQAIVSKDLLNQRNHWWDVIFGDTFLDALSDAERQRYFHAASERPVNFLEETYASRTII
jgi:hypothetical protein